MTTVVAEAGDGARGGRDGLGGDVDLVRWGDLHRRNLHARRGQMGPMRSGRPPCHRRRCAQAMRKAAHQPDAASPYQHQRQRPPRSTATRVVRWLASVLANERNSLPSTVTVPAPPRSIRTTTTRRRSGWLTTPSGLAGCEADPRERRPGLEARAFSREAREYEGDRRDACDQERQEDHHRQAGERDHRAAPLWSEALLTLAGVPDRMASYSMGASSLGARTVKRPGP